MDLYHSAKGSVNYTIVGSPTIVDGVASGFSDSDYLQTSNALSSSSNNIFIKIRFKTPSTIANGSTNICFFGSILTNNNCIRLYRATSYGIYVAVFGWDLFAGRNLIEENTWYTIDFSYIDGISTCTLYDKNGAVLNSSSSSTLQVNIDNVGYFGGKYSQSIDSIDLKQTYIKVNGQPWFGVCPVEVKKHQLRGPVGYTVVGSPTITDGIASGFSENNGLSIANFPAATSNWEFAIKAIDGPGSSQLRIIVMDGMYLRKINHYWNLYFTNGSETWASQVSDYPFIKIVKTNNTAALYQSADGVNYSLVEDNLNIGDGLTDTGDVILGQSSIAWDGSIDLNQTYIKVNGKLWYWQPRETEKIVVNGVTVYEKPSVWQCTAAGSLGKNSNNIVYNFSSSNYFYTNNTLPTPGNFEVVVTFYTYSHAAYNYNLILRNSYYNAPGGDAGFAIAISNMRVMLFGSDADGSTDYPWLGVEGPDTIPTEQESKIKLSQVGNLVTLSIKRPNDSDFVTQISGQLHTGFKQGAGVCFGGGFDSTYFRGDINLNQTYIVTNGTRHDLELNIN